MKRTLQRTNETELALKQEMNEIHKLSMKPTQREKTIRNKKEAYNRHQQNPEYCLSIHERPEISIN